jgi:hypothetical protein
MALKLDPLGGPLGKLLGDGLEALAQQKLTDLTQRSLKPLQQMQQPQQVQEPTMPQQPMIQQQAKQQKPTNFIESLNELLNPEKKVEEFKIPSGLKQTEAKQLADIARKRQESEKYNVLEREKQEKKNQLELEKIKDKETQKYYQDLISQSDSAKEGIKRLNRMKYLIDHGSLPFASFYNALEDLEKSGTHGGAQKTFVGDIISTLIKPIAGVLKSVQRGIFSTDTEEFEKLSNDFIRGAKQIFGNKITNDELRAYMKSIPTLSQTDNGKKAVIRNMDNLLRGQVIKTKVAMQIIKENKGKRPTDFESEIDKRSKKKLDKLSDRFIKGLPASKKEIENMKKIEEEKAKNRPEWGLKPYRSNLSTSL